MRFLRKIISFDFFELEKNFFFKKFENLKIFLIFLRIKKFEI